MSQLESLRAEIGGINSQIQSTSWERLADWNNWRETFRSFYDDELITTDKEYSQWRFQLDAWKDTMRADSIYAPPWVVESKSETPPPTPKAPKDESEPSELPPFEAPFDMSTLLLPAGLVALGVLIYRAMGNDNES